MMLIWTCALLLLLPLPQSAEPQEATTAQAPSETPTSQPVEAQATLRKPVQAEILRSLLGRQEHPKPIRPQVPADGDAEDGQALGIGPDGQALLLDGTYLTERPGRLVHEGGRPKFVLQTEDGSRPSRTLELLPNQLLEALEREAEAGFTEFIVSGEVTRYNERNFLLLRKILRRVDHGNLSP